MPTISPVLMLDYSLRALLLVTIAAGVLIAPRVQAQAENDPHEADVLAVAERFTDAIASADSVLVAGMLLPDALILESGGIETRLEYMSAHFHADAAFLQAMTREPGTRQVRIMNGTAYVASTSRFHGTYRERDLDVRSAELLVLRHTDVGWRVAAVHWSSR